eukprot:1158451-Pelagomonas_calceolata.AAC.6
MQQSWTRLQTQIILIAMTKGGLSAPKVVSVEFQRNCMGTLGFKPMQTEALAQIDTHTRTHSRTGWPQTAPGVGLPWSKCGVCL